MRKRRHGMGFLGLGSTITCLGMKYGAEDSVKFTEDVSREMAVAGWEAAGRPPKNKRPGQDEVVAVSASRGDIKRYMPTAPINDVEGDIDALPMWAGQGVGLVKRIQPVAEIVHEIDTEAKAVLAQLGR
jgi:nitronate monooxygenase